MQAAEVGGGLDADSPSKPSKAGIWRRVPVMAPPTLPTRERLSPLELGVRCPERFRERERPEIDTESSSGCIVLWHQIDSRQNVTPPGRTRRRHVFQGRKLLVLIS